MSIADRHPPTPALTIDMDALLERATADCLDSSDLEEFCAALIRRIITLETAMGFAVLDTRVLPDGLCVRCSAVVPAHRPDCPIGALARELGMAP
jgi:hypothetical protein